MVSGVSLPTSAEARRLRDDEPAVALVGLAREQHVQRRAELLRGRLAAPAGTSCTCPSVIMTTPASRCARHVGHSARSAR